MLHTTRVSMHNNADHYSPSKLGNTMHLLCNRNRSCCSIVISAGAPLMQAHLKTEIFDLINIKGENSAE